MNLRPPPNVKDLPEVSQWLNELYEFLKYPTFHIVRFVPRTTCADISEGNLYYDSDTNALTLRDDASWEQITTSAV